MKQKKQRCAPMDPQVRMQLYIMHQAGKTNAEMADELSLSETMVDKLLAKIGKRPNVRKPAEESPFKVHVEIPQGNVVRAERPPVEISEEELPY